MGKVKLKNHGAFLCASLAVIAAATLRQIGFRVEDPFDWLCSFSALAYTSCCLRRGVFPPAGGSSSPRGAAISPLCLY